MIRPVPDPELGPGAAPGDGDLAGHRIASVPLVGRIAAGGPIFADQSIEDVILLPRQLVGEGDLILLRVVGDSMIDAAITDGDWVAVRRESDVENGDIVAATFESDTSADQEATIKTYKKSAGHVWLIPHNPRYDPIPGDEAKTSPGSARSTSAAVPRFSIAIRCRVCSPNSLTGLGSRASPRHPRSRAWSSPMLTEPSGSSTGGRRPCATAASRNWQAIATRRTTCSSRTGAR